MSQTIEQKVVQMKFDNRDFEKNVSTSMSSLQKFKESLNFKGASKGLDELNHATSKFSFHPLGDAADAVGVKMDAMAVASITAIQRIVNSAIDAGAKITKSLTIEPVSQGYSEYELKMGSVQTMLASGKYSLEEINEALERLNEYSDQTIYSFSDMTASVAKFMNAGVDLNTAIEAIKGISNEAALSGANAQEASRAMYNFAQSLSSGVVRLEDWKSIEVANMATEEFRQELIKTAVKLETLVDTGEGYISTTTDAQGRVSELFNATSKFNQSLSSQWLTTEVLTSTLAKYAGTEEDVGIRANEAATEIKTFSMLLDTLKESVGSGWAKTFELIIGDFGQAKKLLTAINEVASGIIDAQSDTRNTILKDWQKLGGRDDLIEAFKNVWSGIVSILEPIKEAFQTVVPPLTGERLAELTRKFRDFTAGLHLSEEEASGLKNVLTFIFKSIRFALSLVTKVSSVLTNLTGKVSGFSVSLLGLFADTGSITGFLDKIFGSDKYTKIVETFNEALDEANKIFHKVKVDLATVVKKVKESEVITQVIDKIKERVKELGSLVGDRLISTFGRAKEFLSGLFDNVVNVFGSLIDVVSKFKTPTQALNSFIDWIKEITAKQPFFKWLGGAIKFIRDHVDNLGRSIMAFIKGTNLVSFFLGVKSFFIGVKDRIVTFAKSINLGVIAAYAFAAGMIFLMFTLGRFSNAGAVFVKSLAKMFDEIGGYFKAKKIESYSKSVIGFAAALAIFVGIMLALTMLEYDTGKFQMVAYGMLALAGAIIAIYAAIVKIGNAKKEKTFDPKKGIIGALDNFVDGITKSMKKLAKAKAFKNIAIGIAILIGDLILLAVAIRYLINMPVWDELGIGQIGGKWNRVVAAFVAIYLLSGAIRLAGKSALAAGVGLVLITLALGRLVSMIDLISDDAANFNKALGTIVIITLILLAMIAIPTLIQGLASKWAGGKVEKATKGIGLTILAISVAILIMVKALEGIKGLVSRTDDSFEKARNCLYGLMALIVIMMAVSKLAGQHILKFGAAMILISISLAALVGVLKLLTMVIGSEGTTIDQLAVAMVILGLLVGMIALLMWASSATEKAKILPIIGAIVMIGELFAALLILAVLPMDRLINAAISMMIVIASVSLLFVAMSSLGNIEKMRGVIAGLVGAVALLLILMVGLAHIASLDIDADKMIAIGAAIALVFLSLAGALVIANKFGTGKGGAGAMLVMALALGVVAAALYVLCKYDWTQILMAALGISMVMGVLAVVCMIATGGLAGAGVLILAAVAVGVLAAALYVLAQAPIDGIVYGALALIGIIIGISAAFLIFAAAGAIAYAVAPGLVVLTITVLAISVAMLLGAAAVALITTAIVGFSNHIPVISANVIMLAQAFKIFIDTVAGAIEDAGGIGVAIGGALIGGLAGGLTGGFGLIGGVIGGLVGFMVDMFRKDTKSHSPSLLFEALGICIPQGIAVGIESGTPTVSQALSSVGDALMNWFDGVKDFFGGLFGGAGTASAEEFISNTASTIATGGDTIADGTLDGLVDEFIASLGTGGENSGEAFMSNFKDYLTPLTDGSMFDFDTSQLGLDKLGETMTDFFSFDTDQFGFGEIFDSIQTNMGDLGNMFSLGGENGANSFFGELTVGFESFDPTQMMGNIEDMMGDFGGQFGAGGLDSITQYTNAFGSGEDNLLTTISGVGGSGVSSMGDYTDDYYSVGEDSVDGFIKGANSKLPSVKEVGLGVAKEFITSLKEGLTSHSPSKKAMEVGTDTTSGYVIGILNGLKSVSDSADEVGTTAMSALVNSVSSLEDRINDNLDVQPTIRPVMDLSEIQRGTTTLDSLIYPTETFKMASINDHMINATLDARSAVPTNEAVVTAINKLHNDFGDLQDSNTRLFDFLDHYIPELGNMQVVMDSGAVVGQIGSKMDSRLGSYAMRQRRQ